MLLGVDVRRRLGGLELARWCEAMRYVRETIKQVMGEIVRVVGKTSFEYVWSP